MLQALISGKHTKHNSLKNYCPYDNALLKLSFHSLVIKIHMEHNALLNIENVSALRLCNPAFAGNLKLKTATCSSTSSKQGFSSGNYFAAFIGLYISLNCNF